MGFSVSHATKSGGLIITARQVEALIALKVELKAAHLVQVTIIPQDLASADNSKTLHVALNDERIDRLINNSSFDGRAKFFERDLAIDLHMIDPNITALGTLCHLIETDMIKQVAGKILNVSSTASYMPGHYKLHILRSKLLYPVFLKWSQKSSR